VRCAFNLQFGCGTSSCERPFHKHIIYDLYAICDLRIIQYAQNGESACTRTNLHIKTRTHTRARARAHTHTHTHHTSHLTHISLSHRLERATHTHTHTHTQIISHITLHTSHAHHPSHITHYITHIQIHTRVRSCSSSFGSLRHCQARGPVLLSCIHPCTHVDVQSVRVSRQVRVWACVCACVSSLPCSLALHTSIYMYVGERGTEGGRGREEVREKVCAYIYAMRECRGE
jgi:hypothetical protein